MRLHLLRLRDGRVECLGDLGLQPRLLVQADAEVGEQDLLGAAVGVRRRQGAAISRERHPQEILAVG